MIRAAPGKLRRPYVPLLMSNDDPLMVSETLRQLNAAARLEMFETVICVNGEYPREDDPSEIARQYSQYEALVDYLQGVKKNLFPQVMLRTFLTQIRDRNMNRVWSATLTPIINESIVMGRDPRYPVIRFDLDSTGIRKNAVPALAEAIRNGEAHLVKVPTSFGLRNGLKKNAITYGLDLMDPAERRTEFISFIYALAKDMIESQLEDTEERAYNEESGSGAQIINWMRVLTIARHNDPEQLSDDGENRIFLEIAKVALDKEVAPLRYIDPQKAVHHTSYRRMKKLAATLPPWQIPLSEEGPEYQSYVQMIDGEEKITPHQQIRTLQDVMAMVGVMLMRQEVASEREITLPQLMRARLAHAIDRGKFWHGGQPISSYPDWISEARRLGALRLQETSNE